MENLLQRIKKNLELCLFDENLEKKTLKNKEKSSSKVIVCVSGGCDSVALLHLLHKLSKLLFLELHILHFNHQLRSDSDQEQRFVKNLAENLQLPFYSKKSNEFFHGHSGFQELARKWRIKESHNLLERLEGDYIATAHHADDQIETLLLKILRGVHISKLHGMSWKALPFIRPLLNFKKSELQDYLKSNNLNWMEDSSNKSPKYLRNRVRRELIPLLEELTREGLQNRIFDLTNQSKILRKWLESSYFEWNKNKVKKVKNANEILYLSELNKVDKILKEEIIYNFIFDSTGHALSYRNLLKIFDLIRTKNASWEFHLTGDFKIMFSSGEFRIKKQ